jgi:hypothetical protein
MLLPAEKIEVIYVDDKCVISVHGKQATMAQLPIGEDFLCRYRIRNDGKKLVTVVIVGLEPGSMGK